MQKLLPLLALVALSGCGLYDSDGIVSQPTNTNNNTTTPGCSFKLDGEVKLDQTVVLDADKKVADFTFTAASQLTTVFSSVTMPDSSKRVYGIKLGAHTAGVTAGLAIINKAVVDFSNLATLAGTFPNNGIAVSPSSNPYPYLTHSTNMSNGNALATYPNPYASGDVVLMFVDGGSWKVYINGILSSDQSINGNNIPYMSAAIDIGVLADTIKAAGGGTIHVELLSTKADMQAAGVDFTQFPIGTQTICGESLR